MKRIFYLVFAFSILFNPMNVVKSQELCDSDEVCRDNPTCGANLGEVPKTCIFTDVYVLPGTYGNCCMPVTSDTTPIIDDRDAPRNDGAEVVPCPKDPVYYECRPLKPSSPGGGFVDIDAGACDGYVGEESGAFERNCIYPSGDPGCCVPAERPEEPEDLGDGPTISDHPDFDPDNKDHFDCSTMGVYCQCIQYTEDNCSKKKGTYKKCADFDKDGSLDWGCCLGNGGFKCTKEPEGIFAQLMEKFRTSEEEVAAKVYNFILPVGIAMGVGSMIVAGYTFMTSQGNPDKVKAAKDRLTAAVAGTFFIVLSLVILKVIINTLFK